MQQKKNDLISAVIITYNEENNLNMCLKSINWIGELIVVDSYSTDKTVNIARQYTNKIFYKRFNNNFSTLRNFALNQVSSTSKWILVIDADENLPVNSRQKIEQLIKYSKVEGFWLPRRNYINADTYLKYGLFYPDYQLRLFQNRSRIRYKDIIHEELTIEKNKTREINSLEIYHNFSHTKYDSFMSFRRFIPYIKIESEYIASTKKTNANLFFKGSFDIVNFFFQSFIRGKGYKDGYLGFRAAIVFSLYRGFVSFFAIKYKKIIS